MKVVILCGGLGTRLREETEFRPKPMVEVGGRPILWHIMKSYAHYGFREFVLCLGYRGQYHQGVLPELRGDEQRFLHPPRRENADPISRVAYRAGIHRHAGRHRPGVHDRRAHPQDPALHRWRHLPDDLRRRPDRRQYRRSREVPPKPRTHRHRDHRAADFALRPDRPRQDEPRQQLQRKAQDRRLDERRLLRAQPPRLRLPGRRRVHLRARTPGAPGPRRRS